MIDWTSVPQTPEGAEKMRAMLDDPSIVGAVGKEMPTAELEWCRKCNRLVGTDQHDTCERCGHRVYWPACPDDCEACREERRQDELEQNCSGTGRRSTRGGERGGAGTEKSRVS